MFIVDCNGKRIINADQIISIEILDAPMRRDGSGTLITQKILVANMTNSKCHILTEESSLASIEEKRDRLLSAIESGETHICYI